MFWKELKPYLDRQTFMETMMDRLQAGLHETTDMAAAFKMIDQKNTGFVDAEDLCKLFSIHEEPLGLEEAQV